jgi:rhomboid protease GluP
MGALFRESPLTFGLILANLLVYGLSAYCAGALGSIDNRTLVECGGVYGPAVMLGGQWWRLVTAMFLHGGLEHLLLNMISLLIVGRMMELTFSRSAYLGIYFASGMLGFVVSLIAHPVSVSIGASGAIFGLFGAMGGYAFFHRRRLGERYGSFMKEFGVILGLNLILGLTIPSIDMSAHMGGLLLGLVGGYLAIQSSVALWAFLLLSAAVSAWIVSGWVLPNYRILYLPLN